MNRRHLILSAGSLVLASSWREQTPIDTPSLFGQGLNQFSLNLLQAQLKGGGNLIQGSASLSLSLALASLAATPSCRQALVRELSLPTDVELLCMALAGLLADLGASPKICRIATGLWIDPANADFREDFLASTRKSGSEARRIDLRQQKSAAAEINRWIAEICGKDFGDCIRPEDLPQVKLSDLVIKPAMIIVNACWFQDAWQARFEPKMTSPRRFRGNAATREIPFMHQSSRHHYAAAEDFQMLEINFADTSKSLLLLLPEADQTLKSVMVKLDAKKLASVISHLSPCQAHLALPRISLQQDHDVIPLLPQVGLHEVLGEAAFDQAIMPRAEAAHMRLGKLNHRARIHWDEEGAQAAAVTSQIHFSIGCAATMPEPVLPFVCDRPFVFFVRDKKSGSLLFSGVYQEPEGNA